MIAKEELAKPRGAKESSWLKKTQSGSVRLNRWVGIVAVLLVAGSADEVGSSVASSSASATSVVTKSMVGSTSSSLHVSPMFTVSRREEEEPQPTFTGVPRVQRRMYRTKAGVAYVV